MVLPWPPALSLLSACLRPRGRLLSLGDAARAATPCPVPSVAPVRSRRPPNIVLVTTDDQTLYDMRWMPKTRRLLGGHGITFTRSLSPAPLCYPRPAEIVTGQCAQNNGVTHNHGAGGGFQALRHKGNTLGAWLADAGYQTALVGKYLTAIGLPTGARMGGPTGTRRCSASTTTSHHVPTDGGAGSTGTSPW